MNRVQLSTKWKKTLGNIALMLVSSAIGLVLCEVGSRLIVNPADYLSVDMIEDSALGRVIRPGTTGFDKWGFRNRTVPESADIVTIGDSHTYGNCATMDDSWPSVLGRLTGRTVYNLGLGGYGPNQYYHLFKTRALTLKPRLVVVGLYMGDDFENAFLMTYGLPHWSYLRELPAEKVNFDIWETTATLTWHKNIRVWLSRHSVIYKLVFHGPLAGRLKGELQIKQAAKLYDSATSLTIPEQNICEAFLPKGILRRLDQDSESVREGMRITFKLLKEMNEMCRKDHVQFLVAVIPTKEMVFADILRQHTELPLSDVIEKLVTNETIARKQTFGLLEEARIGYVDALPALRGAVEHEIYARAATDMHPNKNGYKVIAEAISAALTPQK